MEDTYLKELMLINNMKDGLRGLARIASSASADGKIDLSEGAAMGMQISAVMMMLYQITRLSHADSTRLLYVLENGKFVL